MPFQVWGKESGNNRSPNVHQRGAAGAWLEMGQSRRQVCKSKWCYWNRTAAMVRYRASPQSPQSGFGQAAGLLSRTCLPGRHRQPRTSHPGCPLWGPALEQGTAGAVITQGCVWPGPEQPLHSSLGYGIHRRLTWPRRAGGRCCIWHGK